MKNKLSRILKSLVFASVIATRTGLLVLVMYYIGLNMRENVKNINLNGSELTYSSEEKANFNIKRINFKKHAYEIKCENIKSELICEMDQVKYVFNIENFKYGEDVTINSFNVELMAYAQNKSILKLFTDVNKNEYVYDIFSQFIMAIGIFAIFIAYLKYDSLNEIALIKKEISEKEKLEIIKYARISILFVLSTIIILMIVVMCYLLSNNNAFKIESFYERNVKTNQISKDGEFIVFNNVSRVSYNEVFELNKNSVLNNGVESLRFYIDKKMKTNNQYKCKYDKGLICYNNGNKYVINISDKNIELNNGYAYNTAVDYMNKINSKDFKLMYGIDSFIKMSCLYIIFILAGTMVIDHKKDEKVKKIRKEEEIVSR